ncbi:hypothetical protein ACH4CE_35370 [Streptomyces gelaticus]|uniref:hypothetical protein n=1 Tax=Streptomyces gelaticus TaxID=285446 RepID=UPI0037A0CE4C
MTWHPGAGPPVAVGEEAEDVCLPSTCRPGRSMAGGPAGRKRWIHGVDGKPHRFLPALAKHAPGLHGINSSVWVTFPEPLATPAAH